MAKSILTPAQADVLRLLGNNHHFSQNYYLTGGTALAEYYLHHRLSEDLDFFTQKEVDKLWLTSLAKEISIAIRAKYWDFQESFNRNLIFFTTPKGLLKTEFTYFPFTPIEKPSLVNNISIDSLTDIAVNKFFAIYQNPSARHFIDLYLILTQKSYSWDNLEKNARIKFDTNIDPLQLGTQLIKAQDIKDLPKMLSPLPQKKWRDFFVQKAISLKERIVK